ncbi:unnamed protein product [Allacma fusca]|uniref:Uncharacterized protein n=1 Tax=Allacma fusca TaxID=39272 RepID=A0A8J2NYS2_9HEXA|nr:unnamed protein product [Allacma fusca]
MLVEVAKDSEAQQMSKPGGSWSAPKMGNNVAIFLLGGALAVPLMIGDIASQAMQFNASNLQKSIHDFQRELVSVNHEMLMKMKTARQQMDVTTTTTKRSMSIPETSDMNSLATQLLIAKCARKYRTEDPDVEDVAVKPNTPEPSVLSQSLPVIGVVVSAIMFSLCAVFVFVVKCNQTNKMHTRFTDRQPVIRRQRYESASSLEESR